MSITAYNFGLNAGVRWEMSLSLMNVIEKLGQSLISTTHGPR